MWNHCQGPLYATEKCEYNINMLEYWACSLLVVFLDCLTTWTHSDKQDLRTSPPRLLSLLSGDVRITGTTTFLLGKLSSLLMLEKHDDIIDTKHVIIEKQKIIVCLMVRNVFSYIKYTFLCLCNVQFGVAVTSCPCALKWPVVAPSVILKS